MFCGHVFPETFIAWRPVIVFISLSQEPWMGLGSFSAILFCCHLCLNEIGFPVLPTWGEWVRISWPTFMTLGLPLLLYWKMSLKWSFKDILKFQRSLKTASSVTLLYLFILFTCVLTVLFSLDSTPSHFSSAKGFVLEEMLFGWWVSIFHREISCTIGGVNLHCNYKALPKVPGR